MSVAYFQIPLSVRPKAGGEAELVPPEVLQGLNYHFVVVKDNGEEGIINLEANADDFQKVENTQNCKKLSEKKMESLRDSYPTPQVKKRYRQRPATEESDAQFEVDEQGNKIADSYQTVRSGFYLIDVPILEQV